MPTRMLHFSLTKETGALSTAHIQMLETKVYFKNDKGGLNNL